MYDRKDLEVRENRRIIIKVYTGGQDSDGVRYWNWKTLIEVNENDDAKSRRVLLAIIKSISY